MKKNYTLALLFLTVTSLQAQKIKLLPQNIINISAKADANTLIDEQAIAADPKSGSGGIPKTTFNNGYQGADIYYPLEVVIDLFGLHTLTDIYFYDINGSDSLIISTGNPGSWIPLIKTVTNGYMSWKAFPINKTTRFIHLKFKSPSTLITEIVLYGAASGPVILPVAPVPVAMKHPLMDDFIGMNSFHDVPDSIQKVVTQIREYHNWDWDEGNKDVSYTGYPNNQYAWNPSWVSGTGWGWNFDDVYTRSLKNGLVMQPDLMRCAPYMTGNDATKSEVKPVRNGKNPEVPASYTEHADYLYQFAARYGKVAKPASTLKLRPDNSPKSGLGLVRYLENWNEQDKNWLDRNSYFSPFEFAAMCSADYDGHMGTMGNTAGVKNADPSIKMAMGGLAGMDTLYIKSMLFWSQQIRNGSFPADILNFHHYSNDAGGQGGAQTKAISPEDDNLKNKVASVVAFRNRNLPGKEVWLSEFGYDSNPSSVQSAPPIGIQSPWETQARWLIRAYLAIVAGGADRAHMFMLRDVDGSQSGIFSSCGLTTATKHDGVSPAYTKKNSWYYVYTFRKRLTGYRFKQEIFSGNPNVLIYSFENEYHPDSIIYIAWAPTSKDITVKDYVLQFPNALSVSEVELTNKDTSGLQTSLILTNQSVKVDVDEKPDIFLIKLNPLISGIQTKIPLEQADEVNVFPNPFTNSVTILLNRDYGDIKITLTDIRGLLIKTETLQGISKELVFGDIAPGPYFLSIEIPSGKRIVKIVNY